MQQPTMRAVYKMEKGKFKLVAAFNVDTMPPLPSDWAQEIADWLNNEGETTRITECTLSTIQNLAE